MLKPLWEALAAQGWTLLTAPDLASTVYKLPDTPCGVAITRGGATLTIRQAAGYDDLQKSPLLLTKLTVTLSRVDRVVLPAPAPDVSFTEQPPVELVDAAAYVNPGSLVLMAPDETLLLIAEWDAAGAHALVRADGWAVAWETDADGKASNYYGVSVRDGVTPDYPYAMVSAFPLVESLVDAGARIFQPFTLYDRGTQEAVHVFSAALPVLARLPDPVTVQGVTYDRAGRRT
ncbi:hypothetical protein [Deinococcus kurensis]|uniref:hypothetical protein n=1 Tax=Deinococcus kurensis TaxID=2662757 RepID=UPI0012D2CAE9|nr:hypothetical protein [Deinococcus kurensis]